MENRDITDVLGKIKVNIRILGSGDKSDAVLDEIRSDFLEMMELIKLFLISERDSYYGFYLMNMQFEVDFEWNGIAGIKLNTFPPVFMANPLLLCRFTLKEIIFVTCHEIDHVVLNHPAEMAKVNPDNESVIAYRFNMAADAAVNDRINKEILAEKHVFMSEPDGIITSSVFAGVFNLRNVHENESYAYYYDLIKDLDEEPEQGLPRNGQESVMDKLDDSFGGRLSDHNWEAGEDADEAAAIVKEFINSTNELMNEEKRGLMPGYYMQQVEMINRPPEIKWEAVLKKYVGTISSDKRKTRTRLNRRQPDRFDLSGTMEEKILKIVVAIDTSGSVDDRMISRILNEILAIVAKRKHEITVIECDSKVEKVYRVNKKSDISDKVTGRGGTLFAPVIEYINANKQYRDALLVYFTDGYGEDTIPRPMTYRNLWVVVGNGNLSLSEPYGAVLHMMGY